MMNEAEKDTMLRRVDDSLIQAVQPLLTGYVQVVRKIYATDKEIVGHLRQVAGAILEDLENKGNTISN